MSAEPTTSQQPPANVEAERAVLGMALKDSDAGLPVVSGIPDAEAFYVQRHRTIFSAMAALSANQARTDITAVAAYLQDQGELAAAGGRVYLVELVEEVASTANLPTYIGQVVEASQLRRLISLAQATIQSAYRREGAAGELVANLSGALLRVASPGRGGFQRVGDLLPDLLEHLSQIQQGKRSFGLPTGFPSVDELTGGHAPGDLIIYAGRPGMGKTALMGCEAQYLASTGRKVGLFSAESDAQSLTLRLLSGVAQVDSHRLRRGKIQQSEWDRIARVQARICEWDIRIDDTPSIDVAVLITRAAALKQQLGLDILYVDHLQCLSLGGNRRMDRREGTTEITQRLKDAAKGIHIPIVTLCQLGRKVEERPDRRPRLSDGKETGDIEQIADLFVGLYRPEVYATAKDGDKYLGQAEYLVLKARNGPTGMVPLHYDKEYTRFMDVVDHQFAEAQGEIPF